MPVFDIAGAQRPAQPVTSFYQGKAMRLALENDALRGEALRKEIGAFDAEQDRAERQTQVNERLATVSETNAEANLARVMTDYQNALRGERKEQIEEQNKEITQALSLFESGGEEAAMNYLASVSTPEEMEQFRAIIPEVGGLGPFLKSSYDAIKGVVASGQEPTAGMQEADAAAKVLADRDAGRISREEATIRLKALDALPPQDGDNARKQKIDDYMSFGMDRQTATGVADGKIRMEQNAKTGKVELIDELGNKVREISKSEIEDELIESGPSLWDMAELGTGIASGVKSGYSMAASLAGLPTATQTEVARTTIKTATNSLIKAMSLSSRYPVGEQNRLREELDIKPSVFSSPPLLRGRMIAVHNWLTGELANESRIAEDPNMNDAMRATSQQSAEAIKRYLAQLEPSAPEDLPEGSTFLWSLSKNNFPVWRAPDGTLYEVTD